jgi:hypothetical protein
MAINNGMILTRYRKATYFQESDEFLAADPNNWYVFGSGRDIKEHAGAATSLEKFLWNNISSEICFDLANRIRMRNPSVTSKMHIIQSNCIDATMFGNWENLQDSKLIVHVDPTTIPDNQTIHKYNNTLSKFTGINVDNINCSKKKITITLPLNNVRINDRIEIIVYSIGGLL